MPTDLPPDYKPAPPGTTGGADSLDPGAAGMPGEPAASGDIGGDVVDGPAGVPQPGPDTGAAIPGSPGGGDVVSPGAPGLAPAF